MPVCANRVSAASISSGDPCVGPAGSDHTLPGRRTSSTSSAACWTVITTSSTLTWRHAGALLASWRSAQISMPRMLFSSRKAIATAPGRRRRRRLVDGQAPLHGGGDSGAAAVPVALEGGMTDPIEHVVGVGERRLGIVGRPEMRERDQCRLPLPEPTDALASCGDIDVRRRARSGRGCRP